MRRIAAILAAAAACRPEPALETSRSPLGDASPEEASVEMPAPPPRPELPPLTDAIDLAVGEHHACVVRRDATVACWGDNTTGAVHGDGPAVIARPTTVSGIDAAHDVAAGPTYSCAIHGRDRKVSCWGEGEVVEVAQKDGSDRPRVVAGLTRASALALGPMHACAIRRGGSVWCWGVGVGTGRPYEVLDRGEGRMTYRLPAAASPRKVAGVSHAVTVGVADEHTCVLQSDGRLVCWGSTEDGQCGRPEPEPGPPWAAPAPIDRMHGASHLALSHERTCVLEGGVFSCVGSVPEGFHSFRSSHDPRPIFAIEGATQVAMSEYLVCARIESGAVRCWGDPLVREEAAKSDFERARRIPGLADVAQVDVGENFACARTRTGRVSCWGRVGSGQIGDGTTEVHLAPTAVPWFSPARRVITGPSHTCAVLESGEVRCAGYRDARERADGGLKPEHWRMPELRGAVDLTRSIADLCGLMTDGTIRCRRVPDGINNYAFPPDPATRQTVDLHVANATTLASWQDHHCALTRDGKMACWGHNGHGAFGRAKPEQSAQPVAGPTLAPWRAVAAGRASTCAVARNGRVVCWGDNQSGQLGLPETPGRGLAIDIPPTVVPHVRGARTIAGADERTCAQRLDASVLCWGIFPDPAAPTGFARIGPTRIPAFDGARDLSVGDGSTCAVTSDGRVRCWDATDEPADLPGSLGDVVSVSTGAPHACALDSTGTVHCWGDNTAGALGLSVDPYRTRPTPVARPTGD